MQGGAGAGEVGAWRPQAARGKGGRVGWRRDRSRGPEETQTPGWSLGLGPGPGGSSGRPAAPVGRGWGPLLGAGYSRQEEPWGWGGGFGALLPLHPMHTHTPILCPPPPPPPHTHKRGSSVWGRSACPRGFRRTHRPAGLGKSSMTHPCLERPSCPRMEAPSPKAPGLRRWAPPASWPRAWSMELGDRSVSRGAALSLLRRTLHKAAGDDPCDPSHPAPRACFWVGRRPSPLLPCAQPRYALGLNFSGEGGA